MSDTHSKMSEEMAEAVLRRERAKYMKEFGEAGPRKVTTDPTQMIEAQSDAAIMRLERHFEAEADDRGKTVLRAFSAQVKVVLAAQAKLNDQLWCHALLYPETESGCEDHELLETRKELIRKSPLMESVTQRMFNDGVEVGIRKVASATADPTQPTEAQGDDKKSYPSNPLEPTFTRAELAALKASHADEMAALREHGQFPASCGVKGHLVLHEIGDEWGHPICTICTAVTVVKASQQAEIEATRQGWAKSDLDYEARIYDLEGQIADAEAAHLAELAKVRLDEARWWEHLVFGLGKVHFEPPLSSQYYHRIVELEAAVVKRD